ncbi:MAG: hypothetical protein ACLQGP_04715 [Isosphaeraceae bacterium]
MGPMKVIAMPLAGNRGQERDAGLPDAAIARSDFVASAGPILARPGRAEAFFTMIVLVAGVMGLVGLSFHVTRQDHEIESASSSGAGIIVRSEPIHLWLPRTLAELARSRSQSRALRTHGELRRFLEREGRKDLWYAMTARGHQVYGNFVDITVIRWPYDDPLHFDEMLAVLAVAGGNPPRHPGAGFSTASIHIVADKLLKHDPREVMKMLLQHRSADCGRSP